MRTAARAFLGIAAAICILTAAMLSAQAWLTQRSYERLTAGTRQLTPETQSIDWGALRSRNSELVGWLSVEGTSIDYPVVQTAGKTPDDFYLTHDFWRQASLSGCPYLDRRSRPDGTHLMIFGHQLWPSDRMFSALRNADERDAFQTLGTAHWETPDGARSFQPLCALRIDASFEPIQRFAFSSQADFRAWLTALSDQAAVRAENAETQTLRSTQALTLITCANATPGSQERVVVVFTACD